MENTIHPDYIKASKLIFLSLGIAVGVCLIHSVSAGAIFLSILIYGTLGVLARIGYKYIKTIMLVEIILELLGLVITLRILIQSDDVLGLLAAITNVILRSWAFLIIWKIPVTPGIPQQPQTHAEGEDASGENEESTEERLES